MSDIDDNMLEDFEEEPIAPASKPATPANRNFFIAIAVIGALFLLSLIGLGSIWGCRAAAAKCCSPRAGRSHQRSEYRHSTWQPRNWLDRW
jgi:hypothetical protein